jgi:hypothetical protein
VLRSFVLKKHRTCHHDIAQAINTFRMPFTLCAR